MTAKFIFLATASLVCSWTFVASAEDKPASPPSAVSIIGMTPEAFDKLPPDATIDVNGEHMTKSEFVARRKSAMQSALKNVMQKRQEWSAHAQTDFQTRRKAFLADQETKVKEANAKVQAEADRALAADAAKHGPNWEADKKQALALLDQAAKASGDEQAQLVTRALELLRPKSP
jgi:hypothetical protein